MATATTTTTASTSSMLKIPITAIPAASFESSKPCSTICQNYIHHVCNQDILDCGDLKQHRQLTSPSSARTLPSDCGTHATEAVSSFSEHDDGHGDGEYGADDRHHGHDDGDDDDYVPGRLMVTLLSTSTISFDDTTAKDSPLGRCHPMTSGNPISAATRPSSNIRLVPPQDRNGRDSSISNTLRTPAIRATSVSDSRSTWCHTTACTAAAGAIPYHQGDDGDDDEDVGCWDEDVPAVITVIHDVYENGLTAGTLSHISNRRLDRFSDIFHNESSSASNGILLRQVDGVDNPPASNNEDVDGWKGRVERSEALVASYRAALLSQDHLIESLEQTLHEARESAHDLAVERDRLLQELDEALDEHDAAMNGMMMGRINKLTVPSIALLGLGLFYFLCGGTGYMLILASTFYLSEDILTVFFPCS